MNHNSMTLAEKVNEPAYAANLQHLVRHHAIDLLARRMAERHVEDLIAGNPDVLDFDVRFTPVLDTARVVALIPPAGIWKTELLNLLARAHGISTSEANVALREAKDQHLVQVSIGKQNRVWVHRTTSGGEFEIQWAALFEKEELRGVVLVEKLQALTGKAKSTAYRLISDAVKAGKLIEFLDGREKSYQLAPGPVSET